MFAAGIDSMVPAFAREGIWLFVFLFFVVLFRAQATYWLARGAASGAVLATGRQGFLGTMARWFDGPVPRKGAAMLDKWGIIVIPLCFLTVGIQTAVNAGAGLVRMRWSTYTIAMIPGCVLGHCCTASARSLSLPRRSEPSPVPPGAGRVSPSLSR